LEREVEDVLLLTEHAGTYEALGLSQQRLLVDEVAADHAVLRILAVPHERPHEVDPALRLAGLPLAVRQRPQALQQFPLLFGGLFATVLEATPARTGLEAPDVAEDQRHQRGRPLAPARPGDVHLAGAAHPVALEVGLDRVARRGPALQRREL